MILLDPALDTRVVARSGNVNFDGFADGVFAVLEKAGAGKGIEKRSANTEAFKQSVLDTPPLATSLHFETPS